MANPSTFNQRMQAPDASEGLDAGMRYAADLCSGKQPAPKQYGEANDCDSAFLADRGYFSGTPS